MNATRWLQSLNLHNLQPCQITAKQVVTIGNFDGCHIGHQKLITQAQQLAKENATEASSLSFIPRPVEFFQGVSHRNLFTQADKANAFRALGLNQYITCTFDQKFSQLSPTQFYKWILKETLQVTGIVVGYDFHFGKNRMGDAEALSSMCKRDGIAISVIEPVTIGGDPVSSSRIRNLLASGNTREASQLLGAPFCVTGIVQQGKQLGRQLGIPTMNIPYPDHLVALTHGVYSGTVRMEEASYAAVINVGTKPTVSDSSRVNIEAHLLSPIEGISHYGQEIKVSFNNFIRHEIKFSSLEELKKQIQTDIASCT